MEALLYLKISIGQPQTPRAQHADLSENGLSGFRNDIDLRKLHEGPLRTPTSVSKL